ncbi:MAG: phage portal protein [Planctomycetia bacterium]|nr:phage portal protein [Planctomycetia bacterium]
MATHETVQETNGHDRDNHADEAAGGANVAAATRIERQLREAWQGLWDSIVDPRDALWDDDGTRWQLVGGDAPRGGAAAVAFSTETEHRQIRAECRALAVTNEFAINGHENRVSYIVGSGHTYRAVLKKGAEAPAELVADVQTAIDEFVAANCWHRRQQEIVRRRDRDGEVFLRFFAAPDRQLRVRFVEPGQVTTPPTAAADPAASFGIITDADDVETALAYYIDGTLVNADDIQHRKANVDGNVKRGLPLFFPVRKNLRRAEKLLRNMSVVAEIQSAIALIRRHQGATRSAVEQFVARQSDATTQSPTGKTTSWQRFGPGTILDSHAGIEYDFPAQGLDAGSFVTVLQAELRAIAARLVMPEFMLTSDASNANYSSTMVAEGPAVKMFDRLQAEQIEADRDVMNRVVRAAARAGRLPEDALAVVEIQAAAPSLAVRDTLREAQVSRIESDAGILSPQTWSQRRGLDYAQEQANIEQHRELTGRPAAAE